ncbi:MAG: RNA-binding protein [Anaerolineae bacterium]|nr:RNA-binding protein [Candidatus Roseilinea sp.]MDW8451634.1 RNA-binding protein [Anaerolineae bacterium]
MASRLYVGNLAYSTTDEGLRNFFAAAGEVKSAEIVFERGSGRSKGFGFVEMATDEGAQNAINTLNGKLLDQRPIRIDFAKPKEERPRSVGGYAQERANRSNSSGGNRGNARGSNRDRRGSDRERNRDRRRDDYYDEDF